MSKKSISTEQTDANIAAVLAQLAETPQQLAAMAASVLPEALTRPLAPGERTPTEVMAHLVNTEALNTQAIILALLIKVPLLPKLHAERNLGKLLRHDRDSFEELLAYFTYRRKVLLRVLDGLSEKQWSRQVREEGKQRQESVYWRARGQALHEL
ncbi:MAG: DinB family protein, partial [Anaerolineales bacterium]